MAGKFRLTNLDLDEISLVPSGDDPEAKVVLAKTAPVIDSDVNDSIARINMARIAKARDGDGDGMVHDNTPRQRPARPSERKKRGKKTKGMFGNKTSTVEWRKEGRKSVQSGSPRSRNVSNKTTTGPPTSGTRRVAKPIDRKKVPKDVEARRREWANNLLDEAPPKKRNLSNVTTTDSVDSVRGRGSKKLPNKTTVNTVRSGPSNENVRRIVRARAASGRRSNMRNRNLSNVTTTDSADSIRGRGSRKISDEAIARRKRKKSEKPGPSTT